MALTLKLGHGTWIRKYSIILLRPQDQQPAEFVFTFGLMGSFQEFWRQTYNMDRIVKSLEWP